MQIRLKNTWTIEPLPMDHPYEFQFTIRNGVGREVFVGKLFNGVEWIVHPFKYDGYETTQDDIELHYLIDQSFEYQRRKHRYVVEAT